MRTISLQGERRIGVTMLLVVLAISLGLLTPLSLAQTVPTLRFIGFSPGTPPADSLPFRRAFAYAVDRDAVVKAVVPLLNATPRPALSIQHPSLPGHNPALRAYEYDPAKAKEMLAQSGWTSAITILVGPSTTRFLQTYHGAVADGLRTALGIPVNVQPVANFQALTRAAYSGAAAIYMFAWASDARDFGYPSFALGIAHDVVSDPEAHALAEKRDAAAAERLLLEKVLIVPVIYY